MPIIAFLLLLGSSTLPAADAAPANGGTVLADPAEVSIGGFLGYRFEQNRNGRLKHVPMDEILSGFKKRPGGQPWIGEHIGKWLHAATLTWQNTNDPKLKQLMDNAVRELIATQKPDGYLGTYDDKDRWTSWDVWVHKYNLIGLLAYHKATGDEAALTAAKKIGDLLGKTFPEKRDIIASGTHVGMAATSVLEPMVLLYRATKDERYLAFCKYIVESWEQPHGPKILSSLTSHGKVNRTANSKAYEMMSNLVGLCELYKVDPDARYLQAAKAAWDDIRANQMYLTGGTSLREHFQPDGHLPDIGDVAETCANVTWLQLSMQLLELTAEAKYADVIELLAFNHLTGAQADNGEDWCYFTVLDGRKQMRQEVNCCHSSGPRGIALIPTLYYQKGPGRLRINLYGESKYQTELPGGKRLQIEQQTNFPADGHIRILVRPEKPAVFGLELRIPSWSSHFVLKCNGEVVEHAPAGGVIGIDREWQPGDEVTLDLDVTPRWIHGSGEHAGMLAAARGPFILCANGRRNLELIGTELIAVEGTMPFEAPGKIAGARGKEQDYSTAVQAKYVTPEGLKRVRLVLTPFAIAWNEPMSVWLRTPKWFDDRLNVNNQGFSTKPASAN